MPDYNSYQRMKRQREEKLNRTGRRESMDRQDYEKKIRSHKIRVWTVRGVVILLLLIIIGVLYNSYVHKEYEELEVISTIEREESMMCQYRQLGDNILRCSRDGAAYINEKGKTIWDLTFEIQNPLIDVCENYAAIGEAEGNKIFVVNDEGKQGEIETLLPIRQIEVAAQGMVAVVLEDGSKNWINFYDKEGNLLAENKAPLENKGFPFSISISNDGKKLAVSYLQAEGTGVNTAVAFYNFDTVGYNVTDHLMSSTLYEDTVIPRITFLSNDLAVAFGDKICIGYKGGQNPEEIFKLSVEDQVESIFYDENHFGMVFRNDGGGDPYRMDVYNVKGKKLFSTTFEQTYTNVKFVGDEIVLFAEKEFTIYNMKGIKKYSGTTDNGISDIMETGRKYRYLLMHQSEWQTVELK